MSAEVASFLDYLLAGGTGIEPAPCGFGESGTAFFPVLFRLACCVTPEFKPFLVSGRLSTSERSAVKSAVSMTKYRRVTGRLRSWGPNAPDWPMRCHFGVRHDSYISIRAVVG